MKADELRKLRNKFILEKFGVDLNVLQGEEREQFFASNPDFWDKVDNAILNDPEMSMAYRRYKWNGV